MPKEIKENRAFWDFPGKSGSQGPGVTRDLPVREAILVPWDPMDPLAHLVQPDQKDIKVTKDQLASMVTPETKERLVRKAREVTQDTPDQWGYRDPRVKKENVKFQQLKWKT